MVDMMEMRENNADTMTWMLGFTSITKMKLKVHVKEHGVKSFLMNYKAFDFSLDEIEKIDILKRVLEKMDGDIETINFGDMDEF